MIRPTTFILTGFLSVLPLAADEPGIQLFNGKDLTGWVNVNCAPGVWTVRDGSIVCSGTQRGFIRTERMYQNYVLEFDWRHATRGGNAGVFAHADALPQVGAPFPRAIEVQVRDGSGGDVASLFGIRGAELLPLTNPQRGSLEGHLLARPTEERIKPTGEWNHYRLTSMDGALDLEINGKVVTRAWRCTQWKGYVGLESEKGECHFRNLRLTPLPGPELPPGRIARADEGFAPLFDGGTLDGWRVAEGMKGHWAATGGAIDYDGKAEGKEKDLWTAREYGDFVLVADWRFPSPITSKPHPVVLPSGDFDLDETGRRKEYPHPDAGDSGIFLRGSRKAQINIWCQELGSGEIRDYRLDKSLPPGVRAACLPVAKADLPPGEWNRFEITAKGDRVTVVLNGVTVIADARLPGLPAMGPIGLQHHGDPVQFMNIYAKPLN